MCEWAVVVGGEMVVLLVVLVVVVVGPLEGAPARWRARATRDKYARSRERPIEGVPVRPLVNTRARVRARLRFIEPRRSGLVTTESR